MLDHPSNYTGFEVVIGVLAITMRIYADFSGGIDISIGIAQIFGITLTPNFERPYFAVSIADHWRRWHITLGAWFRDYVYYPITISRQFFKFSTWARNHLGKYFGRLVPIAIGMGISFFLVGVWHGAAWKFIAFGLYNSVIIMVGMIFTPWLKEMNEKHHLVRTDRLSWRMLLIAITFVLIAIGKLITGARSLGQAIRLFRAMFSEFNPWIFYDGTVYELGLDYQELSIAVFGLVVLLVVDLIQENGIKIRETLETQNTWFRWLINVLAIFSTLIFGYYGTDMAQDFIYQQF
jgi:D-alanyl-lipoteichoic acid acyltransferase DltB (MBOAT superfamily)